MGIERRNGLEIKLAKAYLNTLLQQYQDGSINKLGESTKRKIEEWGFSFTDVQEYLRSLNTNAFSSPETYEMLGVDVSRFSRIERERRTLKNINGLISQVALTEKDPGVFSDSDMFDMTGKIQRILSVKDPNETGAFWQRLPNGLFIRDFDPLTAEHSASLMLTESEDGYTVAADSLDFLVYYEDGEKIDMQLRIQAAGNFLMGATMSKKNRVNFQPEPVLPEEMATAIYLVTDLHDDIITLL